MANNISITIKVNSDEYKYYEELTKKYNTNRTQLIKKAIRYYDKNSGNDPLPTKAKEIISPSISISDYDHSLLRKVRKEGITVLGNNGESIAVIRNITELLNFVDSKVFRNANS